MSRGLGSRQKAVLNAIDSLGGAGSLQDLAEFIQGKPVTVGGSNYESVRRAVQSLVRRGFLRQFEMRGKAMRFRVEYDSGTIGAQKRFGRPDVVEVHEHRWERFN